MTDWGSFTLYVAFVVGIGIAAHVLEMVERKWADKKFKGM